ncbi:MAG: HAMP domain-containing sensor histidine kinase [Myxococcota bacterium]
MNSRLPSAIPSRASFMAARRESQAKTFAQNLLFAAALLLAFACWDLVTAPSLVFELSTVRLAGAAFCVAVFLMSHLRGFARLYEAYYVVVLSGFSLCVAYILFLIPGGFEIGIAGVVLCIAGSASLAQADPIATAIAGTISILGTVVLMVHAGVPESTIRGNSIFLVAGVGFVLLNSVQNARRAVLDYEAQARLARETARSEGLTRNIEEMREERHVWLENLAGFLRHELKNQIVAVGTSIELVQGTQSSEAQRTFLGRAERSLGRMRTLVSSATEATSLAAALEAERVGTVNWSSLVHERVVEQLGAKNTPPVRLSLEPNIKLLGNEERLAQMADKLLENAAQHVGPAATVDVTLSRRPDGCVEMTVENRGSALPADKERLFDAFVSTRGVSENLGLGLYIARAIARNHGGDVVAEDLDIGPGARFRVRLPGLSADLSGHLSADRAQVSPLASRSSGRDHAS